MSAEYRPPVPVPPHTPGWKIDTGALGDAFQCEIAAKVLLEEVPHGSIDTASLGEYLRGLGARLKPGDEPPTAPSAITAAIRWLTDHTDGRVLHKRTCATRQGGRSQPGGLGPRCNCGLWDVVDRLRALPSKEEGERAYVDEHVIRAVVPSDASSRERLISRIINYARLRASEGEPEPREEPPKTLWRVLDDLTGSVEIASEAPTPETLRAFAEWFDDPAHPAVVWTTLQDGGRVDRTAGYLLRQIAHAFEAVRTPDPESNGDDR